MKRKTGVVISTAWAVLFAGALSAQTVFPLPFSNAGSVGSSNSLWQQITNGFPRGYDCTQSNDFRRFRGAFTANASTTKLAIHSDDGSRVKINGQSAIDFYGENTHFQSGSALRLISYSFATGQEYCVEIDFTNHLHDANDIDGVTLYAYDGGGNVRDGIAVWGEAWICEGGTTTLSACGDGPFTWVSSSSSIATVSGNGASATVQGFATGTATITAYDANGKSGSRQVTVAKLAISPDFLVTCAGVTNTFFVTNPQVTGGVTWTPTGTPSPDTRTNYVAFTDSFNLITAEWNGCTATGYVFTVNVDLLTASTNHLCGSGQVTFTAATSPGGFEDMLTWTPQGLTIINASQRSASYSTTGVYTVSVYCGTSTRSAEVTVHKVNITNVTEYALAGGTAVPFSLSADSFGPFSWEVTPSGPTVNGSGSSVTVSPSSTAGVYTVKASITPLPSCNDTSTLQVVQVTFSANNLALCEGTSNNLSFSVNPPSALSLLSFDTVTNAATGAGTNSLAHVTVNGTNLTVYGDAPGTAYLRVKLGNTTLIGPTITVVRVTFPSDPWYVGVGKSRDLSVTTIPAGASVAFDTATPGVVTVSPISGGVRVTGVAPGTTQIRAKVGGGMICSTKDVTAVRVTFATNRIILCTGNNGSVAAAVDPPGSPVTFTPSTPALLVSVEGTNVTVTPQTNVVATVTANVGGQVVDWFSVESLTVRFPSNPWYAAPGGNQSFTVDVEPADLARHVNFMSSLTNIATVTAGATPRELVIHGVAEGQSTITAWVGTTNPACNSKIVTIITPTITSVQWIQTNGSSITSNNLNPGLGFMFFPDSPLPGTAPSNRISIRATVSPPVSFSNAVHFRVFDVDDPSSTNAPVDSESAAFDNKGAAHTPPPTAPVSTDTNGIAEVTMTLSMQPGNNFRAVAAATASFFNDVGARQNDGLNASVTNSSGAIPGNQITPMLTVWRKLHVEVDSMGPVVGNLVTGNVTGIAGGTTAATNLTLSVDLRTGLTPQDISPNLSSGTNLGRFENGWIRLGTNQVQCSVNGNGDTFVRNGGGFNIPAEIVSGGNTVSAGQVITLSGGTFNITANLGASSYAGGTLRVAGTPFTITANTSSNVTVSGTPQIPFVLHDDDDDSVLPRLPDVSGMAPKWQAAYIVPLFDTGQNTTNDPFRLNSNDQDPVTRPHWREGRGSPMSSVGYWVVMVKNGFQTTTFEPGGQGDNDCNSESTWRAAATLELESVMLLEESIRDWIAAPGGAAGVDPDTTGAPGRQMRRQEILNHEVGHLFGLIHDDGLPANAGSVHGDVMRPTETRQSSDFGLTSLHKLRQRPKPGL